MPSLRQRLASFFFAEDEAANALIGGSPRETISGTVGRACGYGGGTPKPWGPPLRAVIDAMPWFGPGHCQGAAEDEAKRRSAGQSSVS